MTSAFEGARCSWQFWVNGSRRSKAPYIRSCGLPVKRRNLCARHADMADKRDAEKDNDENRLH